MVNWLIIALSPILVLLLIEEAAEFFWKRYMNSSGEKMEGTWKERVMLVYSRLRSSIIESKGIVVFKNSKFVTLLRKKQKDPSH